MSTHVRAKGLLPELRIGKRGERFGVVGLEIGPNGRQDVHLNPSNRIFGGNGEMESLVRPPIY